jgi:hypothetical protein
MHTRTRHIAVERHGSVIPPGGKSTFALRWKIRICFMSTHVIVLKSSFSSEPLAITRMFRGSSFKIAPISCITSNVVAFRQGINKMNHAIEHAKTRRVLEVNRCVAHARSSKSVSCMPSFHQWLKEIRFADEIHFERVACTCTYLSKMPHSRICVHQHLSTIHAYRPTTNLEAKGFALKQQSVLSDFDTWICREDPALRIAQERFEQTYAAAYAPLKANPVRACVG